MNMNKVRVSLHTLLQPTSRLLTARQLICSSCVLYKKKDAYQRRQLLQKFDRDMLYSNPLDRLRELIQVPLMKDGEEIFSPPVDKIKEGERLFISRKGHAIDYLQGALYQDQLPSEHLPEVAFAGRSNVGKSSLIKAMFSHAPDVIVRTSKTPGHTKILNFFQVGKSFRVVDMPGYGENMPKNFVESSETYLKHRRKLRRSFLLIDGAEGVNDVDLIGLNMMEEFGLPYTVVVTKIDQVSNHLLLRHLLDFMALRETKLNHCFPQPFLVSSMTGEGIALLQAFVGYVCGRLQVAGL